jgi:secreted trypsin-like serine protease
MRSLLSVVGLLLAVNMCVTESHPASAQSVQDALRGLTPSAHTRIIGGDPAQEDAWPWQVMIIVSVTTKDGKKEPVMCGGSLIGARWVLTAAHCFSNNRWNLDGSQPIAVAERSVTAQTQYYVDVDFKSWHRVAAPIVHPRFNQDTGENDIALVHLNEPARSQAVPVLLAANRALESPPVRAIVTGWGSMRDLQKIKPAEGGLFDVTTQSIVRLEDVLPNRLMQAELPLVAIDRCNGSYKGIDRIIDERTLCAGSAEEGKDACQGDSGGPMVVHTSRDHWVQIGIVSWGMGCGSEGHPGVYTRVSAFGDWIRSAVGRDLVIAGQEQAQSGYEKPEPAPNAPDNRPSPTPQFDNVAGVTVAFDKGDDVKVGDRVSYRVTTRKPGYLIILDVAPDGKLTQIFPNARSIQSPTGSPLDAARLRPELPLLIPDYRNPYRGFDVRIAGPRGKGLIVAVLSDAPVRSLDVPEAPMTFASAEEAIAAIARLSEELTHGLGSSSAQRPKWSVDIHDYTIW